MKRRDFVKSFMAVGAAVPVASALASVKGAEDIIETFTAEDMKHEITGKLNFNKDLTSGYINYEINDPVPINSLLKEQFESGSHEIGKVSDHAIDVHRYFIDKQSQKTVYVLASSLDVFIHSLNEFRNSMNESFRESAKFNYASSFKIEDTNFVYVGNAEKLRGVERGIKILALNRYWRHVDHDRIIQEVYNRDLRIVYTLEHLHVYKIQGIKNET